MTQTRSEIVEAIIPLVNARADMLTRQRAEAALDIALKAAAEIAFDANTYAEFCAYEKRQSGRNDNKECAEAQMAWRIRDAILALTSEGAKE